MTVFCSAGHLKMFPFKTRLIGKNTKTEPEIAGKTGHFCTLFTLKRGNASLGNIPIFADSVAKKASLLIKTTFSYIIEG
jgi:hypothetical protein